MAPPGKHVMSCFVQYAPYELKGSDWETERESFGDKAQAVLESHFPGFGKLVLHREVVTPVDIEARTGLTEGNIFAGEFLAPQMYFFRPAPGWSQYATPIDGYYQCGTHRPDRGQHLRRGVPGPPDVLLPPGARLEPVRHPDRRLLPVRLGHPPRRLRHRLPRPAGRPAGAPRPG